MATHPTPSVGHPGTSGTRNLVVDGLRTLAILAVLAVHLDGARLVASSGSAAVDMVWKVFSRGGSYGVTIFFVLSGFLITRMLDERPGPVERPGLKMFYISRVARIFPLFMVITVAGAAILATGWLEGRPGYEFCLRSADAIFDGPFWLSLPTLSFNWMRIANEYRSFGYGLHWDVLWSLAIEEQFYLFYPLIMHRLATRRRISWFLVAVMASGPLYRATCTYFMPSSFLLGFTSSFACFDQLAMGGLVYLGYVSRGSAAHSSRLVQGLLGFAGLIGGAMVYINTRTWIGTDRIWAPSVIGLSVALILMASQRAIPQPSVDKVTIPTTTIDHSCTNVLGVLGMRSMLARLLHWATLPGRLSYGCYLWHGIVLFALWPLLYGHHFVLGYLAFLLGTTAVAALSFHFFELPMRRVIEGAFFRR